MNLFQRTFFQVGQALFSVERHGCTTTVFDCGGNNAATINNAVVNAFVKGETINALFISHYDRDHINGVKRLLDYCRVERIFLPMVAEPIKLYGLSGMTKGSFAYEFTLNPSNALINAQYGANQDKPLPFLHFIKEDDGENFGRQNDERHSPIDIRKLKDKQEYESGTDFYFGHKPYCLWIYRVFNRKYMNTTEWKMFLEDMGFSADATCDDIVKQWKRKKIELKNALINAGVVTETTINSYSMTLYTGSSTHCPHFPDIKNGCLYTGDYDAKTNYDALHNVYSDLWDNIGFVQIPHHGSSNNTDFTLIKSLSRATFVISSKKRPYRH